MLRPDYSRQHKEVVRCLCLLNILFEYTRSKIRSHPFQEEFERAEMLVDTRI